MLARIFPRASSCLFLLLALALHSARAAELKKETSAAFDRYIAASEARIASEVHSGPFLYIDSLPEPARKQAYQQLHNGQLLIQQGYAREEGHPIEAPQGLIHDWMGIIFIPNTTLAHTLSIVQDYDHHHIIYAPEVRRSKILSREGDHFRVFLQLYKKSLVTVVLNGEFDITYDQVSPTRVVSRSQSTHLLEVENPDTPKERELPPNTGNGYLWRLNTYWRAEEKDGGVYVQIETIGLTRGVPAIVAWIVKPLLRSIPRGTLSTLLEATRKAVLKPPQNSATASP